MLVLLDCGCVLASIRSLHISAPFLESGRGMQEIDDEFEVRLGRIGNRKAKRATNYLRRVRQEAQKAGASSRRASSFTGSRIGRGHAHGVTLAGRARAAGRRRVVIKTRIVRVKAGDTGAVRAHLRYVQRDGVTRDGQPGELYDAGSDRADGKHSPNGALAIAISSGSSSHQRTVRSYRT